MKSSEGDLISITNVGELDEIKKLEEIRDPIYGLIKFSPDEMDLIDTAPMQRLRRIKQLAFAYLAYPGAIHTRFDHSIGACHIAELISDKLELNGNERCSH